MENLRKIFPQYALPDFISATLGYEYYYFYNAQAAMILDASWFVTDFPEKMKKSYQTGFKQFDYGILYLPPMGAEVNASGEVVKKRAALSPRPTSAASAAPRAITAVSIKTRRRTI